MGTHTHTYLIIGCGYFGSRAAEKLFQKDSHSKIIVVDKSKKALQKVSRLPIQIAVCDAIIYLRQFLSEGRKADYIIPAVPLHLAFEFILSQLKPLGAKRKRIPSISGLPNPVIGKTGDLYTSHANFLCSEDCLEPAQYCTITKKRHPKPLYKILNDLEGAFESRVIRSQQLGPGIGGFRPKVLLDLLENLKNLKKKIGSGGLILISTASRCHGVTSGLSF
jgi:hypothetical protein